MLSKPKINVAEEKLVIAKELRKEYLKSGYI